VGNGGHAHDDDAAGGGSGEEEDEEEGGGGRRGRLVEDEEDAQELERMEAFESKYNFRCVLVCFCLSVCWAAEEMSVRGRAWSGGAQGRACACDV
jgi:hypothetical protein